MTDQVETNSATLKWNGQNVIEIRFASGIRLDHAGITEVIATRKRMQGDRSIGLLLIVPGDTELDMAIISMDHLKVNKATDNVVGFAVVARSGVSEVLLRLYKAYYPTIFQAEVFTEEADARAWLSRCVTETLPAPKN